MDPIQELRNRLAELRTRRDELTVRRQTVRDAVAARPEEERDLTPEEETEIRTVAGELLEVNEEIIGTNDRMVELLDQDHAERSAAAALRGLDGGTPTVQVRREPMTYERGNRQRSYFRDMGLAFVGGDAQARERLSDHRREMDVELPRLEERYAQARFERNLGAAGLSEREVASAAFTRDISRTDGAGGEFVPPLWLLEEYAEFARAGRTVAGLVRNIPLPGGTDSISVPRITGGTQTAPQTADNAAVNEQDLTTGSTTAPVRTIAGQQDIALQLLEQSPLMFDEIVFADLTADYNSRLETQLFIGTGVNGQHTGLLTLSGTNTVTYTDGSPTVPEFWPNGGMAISQAVTARKMPVGAHVMAPRRWYWMASALDGSNRPYVVPAMNGPQNTLAVPTEAGIAEGFVGYWHGLPTYLAGNAPLTLGSGTNEDAVLTARWEDQLLFEGALRTRALPEVLSGTLTVRLQVYSYSAYLPGRFPAGVSKITGTGLVAPSGF